MEKTPAPAKRIFSSEAAVNRALDPVDTQEEWRAMQIKFLSASKQLARFFRNNLSQVSTRPTAVYGADLLVLAGANMPAVLVEVGELSDPLEEKKLQDVNYLARIADAIQAAVVDYSGNNSGISSMDLRQ